MFHENALVFSQSEVHNFFLIHYYIENMHFFKFFDFLGSQRSLLTSNKNKLPTGNTFLSDM